MLTAARSEAAARFCSQARCRQVAEHHFGIGPRLPSVIRPAHQAQVVAAARRARASARMAPESGGAASGCVAGTCRRRCRSRSRRRLRPSESRSLPMSGTIRASLQKPVTTIRCTVNAAGVTVDDLEVFRSLARRVGARRRQLVMGRQHVSEGGLWDTSPRGEVVRTQPGGGGRLGSGPDSPPRRSLD